MEALDMMIIFVCIMTLAGIYLIVDYPWYTSVTGHVCVVNFEPNFERCF